MKLREEFILHTDHLVKAFSDADLLNEQHYKNWLAQTYFFTSHSEKVLRFISKTAKDEASRARWQEHADEETGHENLALGDLKRLGETINNYQVLPSTLALYQRLYYIAQEKGANACLGWALALEGLAVKVDKDYVRLIREKYGDKACRFLIVHTEEDPDHLDKALALCEKEPNQQAIIETLRESTYFYDQMLKKISNSEQELEIHLVAA